MYVYIKTEAHLWTVGFYAPDGTWHTDSDHDSPESAAERVHWLNGHPAQHQFQPTAYARREQCHGAATGGG